jgi:cysteine desulfurase
MAFFAVPPRSMPIYLDHAATTPVDSRVLAAMMPFLTEHFGNPSSVHGMGRRARHAVEESRERVASRLGAEPSEIVFTSGATESNTLAIKGAPRWRIVTSPAEHEAVLRPVERLAAHGREVSMVATDRYGSVAPEDLEALLSAGKEALVSLMYVNNETGAITDPAAIAAVCRRHGALFHCDAVQAAACFELSVVGLDVDLMSLSAHKIGGPRGAGVLFIRAGVDVEPVVEGGAQERGRRGGTENVAAIVGMAEALDLAAAARDEHRERTGRTTRHLRERLDRELGGHFVYNTPERGAAPHIVNIAFPPEPEGKLDGEMLLLNLDMQAVMVSAGSACTSGALEPSHVLLACGLDRATASAAVRFSVGPSTTMEEIDTAVERLAAILSRMRGRPAVEK